MGSLEQQETGTKGRIFTAVNVYCIGKKSGRKTRFLAPHALNDGLCYAQIKRTTRGYFCFSNGKISIKRIFQLLDLSSRDLSRHIKTHHQNEQHFAEAIPKRDVAKPPTLKRGDDQTLNHEYQCLL